MRKIAIIGDAEVTASLFRAIRYIDGLRHALTTRFVLSSTINDAIKLYTIKDFQKETSLLEFSLLILTDREESDSLSLIRNIRFSTRKNLDSPGIPIILLTTSTLSVDDLIHGKTAYLHLRDHGTALSIPFTLKSLNDCFRRAVYFDNEFLGDVKASFYWLAWVHEVLHELKKNNYKEKLEFLEKVVPDDCKDQISHLKSKDYKSVRQELEEIIRNYDKT